VGGLSRDFLAEAAEISLSPCRQPCKKEVQSRLDQRPHHVDQAMYEDLDLAPVRLRQLAGNESRVEEE